MKNIARFLVLSIAVLFSAKTSLACLGGIAEVSLRNTPFFMKSINLRAAGGLSFKDLDGKNVSIRWDAETKKWIVTSTDPMGKEEQTPTAKALLTDDAEKPVRTAIQITGGDSPQIAIYDLRDTIDSKGAKIRGIPEKQLIIAPYDEARHRGYTLDFMKGTTRMNAIKVDYEKGTRSLGGGRSSDEVDWSSTTPHPAILQNCSGRVGGPTDADGSPAGNTINWGSPQ